jgi:hypothetical protein
MPRKYSIIISSLAYGPFTAPPNSSSSPSNAMLDPVSLQHIAQTLSAKTHQTSQPMDIILGRELAQQEEKILVPNWSRIYHLQPTLLHTSYG